MIESLSLDELREVYKERGDDFKELQEDADVLEERVEHLESIRRSLQSSLAKVKLERLKLKAMWSGAWAANRFLQNGNGVGDAERQKAEMDADGTFKENAQLRQYWEERWRFVDGVRQNQRNFTLKAGNEVER